MRLRTIGIVLAVIVVIVVGGLLLLRGRLDSIVAGAIERYGSRLTGTEVTVERVDIALRQGRITIDGLRVANPEGFSDRDALDLDRLTVQIDPESLREQPYVLERIEIAGVGALYEVDAEGRRNLDVIRGNLEQAGGGDEAGEAPPRLLVRHLSLAGGEVQVDAEAVGLGSRTVELPSFTMSDLGAPDGAPADAIGKQVLTRLVRQAAEAAATGQLQKAIRDNLGQEAVDKAKGVLEKLGK